MYIIVDIQTKQQIGKSYTNINVARRKANKLDLTYGSIRYVVKTISTNS